MDDGIPTCATSCSNAAFGGSGCSGLGCQCQTPYSDKFAACVEAACPSSSDFDQWTYFMQGYCGLSGGFNTDSNVATAVATAASAAASTATPYNFLYTPTTLATVAATDGSGDGNSFGAAATTSIDSYIVPSSPATHESEPVHSAVRHGLSKGAKGGVGAGTTIGVLLAVLLGRMLFVLRRRGRKGQTAAHGAPAQGMAQVHQPTQGPDAGVEAGQPAQVNADPSYPMPKYSVNETVYEVVSDAEQVSTNGGNGQGNGESTILGQ